MFYTNMPPTANTITAIPKKAEIDSRIILLVDPTTKGVYYAILPLPIKYQTLE